MTALLLQFPVREEGDRRGFSRRKLGKSAEHSCSSGFNHQLHGCGYRITVNADPLNTVDIAYFQRFLWFVMMGYMSMKTAKWYAEQMEGLQKCFGC